MKKLLQVLKDLLGLIVLCAVLFAVVHYLPPYLGDNELSRTLQSIDTFIMSKIPAVQQALQKSTSVQDAVSPVMSDKEFEELMASYEAFFDEYVDLMKKVQKNPTNAELLAAYSSYMARYADMMAKLESWDDKELTTAQEICYTNTTFRISQKLMSVAAE